MKIIISALLLNLCLSINAYAADTLPTKTDTAHQGQDLHNNKCTTCHTDSVYQRENRMVKTMSALEHQVNNCMKGAAKAEWSATQTSAVIEFLNDRYYKF